MGHVSAFCVSAGMTVWYSYWVVTWERCGFNSILNLDAEIKVFSSTKADGTERRVPIRHSITAISVLNVGGETVRLS